MITWADVIRGILKGLEWITADVIRFAVTMILIFVFFYYFIMQKGLGVDDRIHRKLTELYIAIAICLLMMMANNGVIDAFFSTIF